MFSASPPSRASESYAFAQRLRAAGVKAIQIELALGVGRSRAKRLHSGAATWTDALKLRIAAAGVWPAAVPDRRAA